MPDVAMADSTFNSPGQIDIVIGGDTFRELHTGRKRSIGRGKPWLVETHFGWVVTGNTHHSSIGPRLCHLSAYDTPLEETMQRFWESETIAEDPVLSVEENTCEKHFAATTVRNSSGRTLKQIALDHKEEYPLAMNAVMNDFYVDDLLMGTDDLSEAIVIQRQISDMLNSAGFTLKKWASNRTEALQNVSSEDVACVISLTHDCVLTFLIRVNGGVIKTAHNFAMAAICFACAVSLDAADCIVGCAYCEATFHRGCCRLPSELIDAVLTHIDLHWSCTGCTNILKNPRCRSVKEIGAQVGFQAALTSTVAAVGKLIEPIIAEVRSGFTLLQNAPIPQLCNTDPRPVAGRKRRRIIEDSMSPDVNKNVNIRQNNMFAASSPSAYTNTTVGIPPSSTLPEELMGTDSLSSPLRAAFPQPATDRIWIRLSRLSTAVTVEQVVASVKRRLATDDVLAYCLLRKGVSVDSVNWLSFKVRVPAALRDAALAPSSWPVGIGVREFVQSRQREHGHSSSPITIKHRSLTRTPVVIDRRSMPRTPTSTVYHAPAHASTSQAQTLTSPQLGEHTLNDTTHGPNSTLIDGPLLIRRTSNTNLQQTTLDRFFHE
uniref:uncharacterized protein LOC125907319 n=1 Tax=Anopheles coluzzii TaxID=1518534 RepID=UPI0020FFB676|nr:uncharacterized protein LOC125907319 [Anopheles coluzzii]